jgi:hypothetical protein
LVHLTEGGKEPLLCKERLGERLIIEAGSSPRGGNLAGLGFGRGAMIIEVASTWT